MHYMAKKPRRKNLRSPGKCIFCGGGNLSKEHFWPKWAAPLLRTPSDEGEYREVKASFSGKAVRGTGTLISRPGHVTTKKIRVVCRKCNSEWMGAIETAVQTIAAPLILGNPATLNQDAQTVLARWITLKVMVGEQNVPEDAVVLQEDRDAFKRIGAIPSYIKIWIATCAVPDWRTSYYREAATLTLPENAMPISQRKNVQTTAFGIGALFVYAMVSPAKGIDLNDYIGVDGIPRLWPISQSTIHWPLPNIMRGDGPMRLSLALRGLAHNPNVIWKPWHL
jgi:hypothetical protein